MSTQIKEYTAMKRYLISGIRVFLSGFIPVFLLYLGELKELSDFTSQALTAALFASIVAGLYTLLKLIQEKLSGRI